MNKEIQLTEEIEPQSILKEQVLELYIDNKTYKEIAEILGVSTRTISRYIDDLENKGLITKDIIQKRNKQKNISKLEIEKMILKLRNEGKTLQQISDEIGIHTTTVSNYIKKLRDKGENVDPQLIMKNKIFDLYIDSKTNKEISEILGISIRNCISIYW